jgi:hypothetical protein
MNHYSVWVFISTVHWQLYQFGSPQNKGNSLFLLKYIMIFNSRIVENAGLLARSQYPEGPVTDHFDTGFSWFSCVYKRMLRLFPSFQVATTCLSCSPPSLDFLVFFSYFFTWKRHCHRVRTKLQLIIIIIVIIIKLKGKPNCESPGQKSGIPVSELLF